MRESIIECIHANPGIHFRALLRATETAIGQLDYHLNMLLKEGSIQSFNDAKFVRYFSSDFDAHKMRLYAIMWNDAMRQAISALLNAPMTQQQIVSLLGKSPSTVSWYVQRLRDDKIIVLGDGTYALNVPHNLVQECLGLRQSALDKVINRFSQGWNG